MNPRSLQKLIVILLAVASLGTTALITLVVIRGSGQPDDPYADSLFDHPLPMQAFTLTERSGKTVSLDDLQGKVLVVNTFFTTCRGFCPMMIGRMADFQRRLERHPQRDRIRLISITVDPEHDTPEVLAAYADRFGADPQHWLFLTGEHKDVYHTIISGLKLGIAEDAEDEHTIGHSDRWVLIDTQGGIRGYYPSVEGDDINHLMVDLNRLLSMEGR